MDEWDFERLIRLGTCYINTDHLQFTHFAHKVQFTS